MELTERGVRIIMATAILQDAVKEQLDFVREKYGIKGSDFSCPHMKKMAEAYDTLRDIEQEE